ncbi:DNA repair and recombination protein [Yarrowia sp. E02]|nr:DNA repair and recombination protein [Yarrowia sp. E02]
MPQFGDHYALPEPPKASTMGSDGVPNIPYSRSEERQVSDLLKHNLGPEFVSKRPSPGGRSVHYLEGWKVFNLANEIFGFNGWRSQIMKLEVDYCDQNPETKRWDVGVYAIVRVHLKDGTYREDTGSGNVENCPKRDMALNKSRKEAVTDACKRAMRQFGPSLGNCLYDSDYLSKLRTVRSAKYSFDENNLIRKPEFVIKRDIKQEQVTAGSTAFPSTTSNTSTTSHKHQPPAPAAVPAPPAPAPPSVSLHGNSNASSNRSKAVSIEAMCEGIDYSFDDDDLNLDSLVPQLKNGRNASPSISPEDFDDDIPISAEAMEDDGSPIPVGFFKASVAADINKGSPISQNAAFDINIQSPSIKRTLEHNKSVPVARSRIPMHPKSTNIPPSPLSKPLVNPVKPEITTPVAKKHKTNEN